MNGSRKTRGQALPMVALELWLVAGVAVLASMVGERASERSSDRARAQAGADAVALAVAGGGDVVDLAFANGVVVEHLINGDVIDVEVRSGTARAAARAERPRPQWVGLDPRMREALARAERVLGRDIPIGSGRRSRAEQERLWANRLANPYPVAPPGTSLHELGLAVDVPLDVAGQIASISAQTGLCQPLPASDPVHLIVC
jgi:hypothetical protein